MSGLTLDRVAQGDDRLLPRACRVCHPVGREIIESVIWAIRLRTSSRPRADRLADNFGVKLFRLVTMMARMAVPMAQIAHHVGNPDASAPSWPATLPRPMALSGASISAWPTARMMFLVRL